MTFDHRTTHLHVADLDREIETLRAERSIAGATGPGVVARARRGAGRALISAGVALIGRDGALRAGRA